LSLIPDCCRYVVQEEDARPPEYEEVKVATPSTCRSTTLSLLLLALVDGLGAWAMSLATTYSTTGTTFKFV
jgi:hypothetical protein